MSGHFTRRGLLGALGGTGVAGAFGDAARPRGRQRRRRIPAVAAGATPPPDARWERTYGGAYDDWARSVVETSDGGYVFTGVTASTGSSGVDTWLVKVDGTGDEEWTRTYGDGDESRGRSVIETSDGAYLLAGFTSSGESRGNDALVVRVDAAGNEEWTRTYGGSADDRVNSVVEASDGGYLLAGETASSRSSGTDAWLVKVDGTGDEEWTRTYGGSADDAVESIVEASEGGYLLAGETASSGSGGTDGWLVKVDAGGDVEWTRTCGGGDDDVVESAIETGDGGYLLAGETASSGSGGLDAWLVKVDPGGDTQWERTYGGDADDQAWSIVGANDGGYLLAGDTRSSGSGRRDAWLVAVDTDGDVQWGRTYGGIDDDAWLSADGTRDGGYLLAGGTKTSEGGGWDAWLTKVGGTMETTTTPTTATTTTPTTTPTTTASATTTATPTTTRTDAAGAGGDGDAGDAGGQPSPVDGPLLEGLAAVGGALLVGIGGLAAWRLRSGGDEPDRPVGTATSTDPGDPPPGSGSGGDGDTSATPGEGTPAVDSPAGPDPSPASAGPDDSDHFGVPGGAVGGSDTGGPPGTVPSAPSLDLTYGDVHRGDALGAGGSADVYEATVETADGPVTVALKEPRFQGTLQTDVVERFTREAETWAKLDDHEAVVGVVDWGTEPLPWIAMEYMDGGPLSAHVHDLPYDQALWTAVRIADAIYHAHRHGVAHLDLKPANVLFREVEGAWNVPKVGDWGLAKLVLDHSGSVEGYSPRYAAPEQLADDYGAPDQLTDVYAFGAVCYELFTGKPPFEGDLGRVVTQVLTDDPTPPCEVDPALPDRLGEIITAAMAKHKEDRYQDILRVHDDLRGLLDSP